MDAVRSGNAPVDLAAPHDTDPLTMDTQAFKRLGHEMIDWAADYLANPQVHDVLPATRPGAVRASLPKSPPEQAESIDRCFEDFQRLIVPNSTHWNHPGFLAYFANTGSPPGILAELLTAALNVNAMVWRTGPAATELEEVVLDWLRQLLGLSAEYDGTINDTASSSTLYALAAAREQLRDLQIRQSGLAGRNLPRLRVYCSEEAHSSVDKAAITLGLGLDGVCRVPSNADYIIDTNALRATILEDKARGIRPMAVVGTVGTTSTAAVDPIPELAALSQEHNLWLHVDASYAGSAAMLPELRWIVDGCDRADSFVVNPHKWLLVPMDCSVLYTRKPSTLRAAFGLTPEYLVTPEQRETRNLMDYGISLGRRFRALKLWFVMRAYGAAGLRAMLREQIRCARLFAGWVDEHPHFERLAPCHFSLVTFRHVPPGLAGSETELERHNQQVLERINATGRYFLSHTRAKNRFALRLAIGNLGTTETHVREVWDLISAPEGQTIRSRM
jgi:aromatic-L-amino-acid/L-tryptophan decarboxylase